jgi:hypothetical protein
MMTMDEDKMTKRPMMALFDRKHRLELPGGYWLQKDDDNQWQIGCEEMALGVSFVSNVPVGEGGSTDGKAQRFAEAMLYGRR